MMQPDNSAFGDRLLRLEEAFVRALDTLEAAKPFAKALHQNHVYELTLRLLKEPGGVQALYRYAARFEAAGVFHGSDWAAPERLHADFVAHALHARGRTLAVECLNQLRFLAILNGEDTDSGIAPADARRFLEDVLGYNLDLLFPEASETTRLTRATAGQQMEGVQRLFEFILEAIGTEGLLASIADEVQRILSQRPILVQRVKTILNTATKTLVQEAGPAIELRVAVLINALRGPTELCRQAGSATAYAELLPTLDEATLVQEAEACGDAMWATGLVSPHFAVLLRHLNQVRPEELPRALRLEETGCAALTTFAPLVRRLIDVAVHPETAQCIYGLASLLVDGRLFAPPVAPSLRRLIGMHIAPSVGQMLNALLQREEPFHTISPHAILLAGTLSVLGQPLGVGQGDNPTCQSARAISLWAQVDMGYLLELVAQAAGDDSITMYFEGESFRSSELPEGTAAELHTDLDPISLVLVPHLDRIYAEMGRRVVGRGEDGHKWINPEFHGWWVYRGFAIAIQVSTKYIVRFRSFIRLFYASYHPTYRGEAKLVYPQPLGVASTDHKGVFLGWHAVAIRRVTADSAGEMRAYFYNPNNDGGQRWGQGIVTETSGHGELAGESSLPFHEFAARVYLFHYNEREHGDPAAVPAEEVSRVMQLAQGSWGASFPRLAET